MKQADFWILAPLVLGLGVIQVACVNTEPVTTVEKPSVVPAQTASVDDKWLPLAKDKLHDVDGLRDPGNPGFQLHQEPREELSKLPANKARPVINAFGGSPGLMVSKADNLVDWVQAITSGAIRPRRNIATGTGIEVEPPVMDMDILLNPNGSMPPVRFPHRAHTMWLACANCHPAIFIPQKGANPIRMYKILEGEQCGICHSAVAFSLTECSRCHSVQRIPSSLVNPSANKGGGIP
ncbi:MAG: cytochrome c3 family protein [Gallionellaceae bacterium]|nr:cytochrome c3 family protein [Gallionellaceae bacterium]